MINLLLKLCKASKIENAQILEMEVHLLEDQHQPHNLQMCTTTNPIIPSLCIYSGRLKAAGNKP